jgi:hypothetical protein
MGILNFPPGEWPGVLGSSAGRLPPRGPVAPLLVPPQGPTAASFVPATEAAYGEPTPGELWNTNPSPLGKALGGMMDDFASRMAAAHTRAMAPEAADHGLSERQNLSPWQRAINPITSYPETYMRMNQEARNQVSHGVDQLNSPETYPWDTPATGSEFDTVAPRGLTNFEKGVGNIALGSLGYVGSPINAAYRSLLGQPIEDLTGIPRDYTEFAAQLATPGIGFPKNAGTPTVVPPRPGPNGPSGIASAAAPITQELPAKLPGAVGPTTEAAVATGGNGVVPAAGTEASALNGPMPQLSERYAEPVPPIWKIDQETGKGYWAKDRGHEALDLKALRSTIQEELDKGNYPPNYDPAARFPADSSYYAPIEDTQNIRMVRPATQQKYEDLARSPAAEQRILEAFQRGQEQKANAANWSYVGQYEAEFIKELGPVLGRQEFKKWADTMAATTAGADPTANFLMAHFARYMAARGVDIPSESYKLPYSVGGRYVGPNMAMFRKMLLDGLGITTANPKRYNFANDFLGHYSPRAGDDLGPRLDGPPIDERISRLFDPKMAAPPPGSYGHFQKALIDLAAKHGVDPQYFRDLVWAGAAGDHPAKSMMQIINEVIERTHRITGMARDEIVRRGLVRAEIPLFGLGGVMAHKLAGQQLPTDDDGT